MEVKKVIGRNYSIVIQFYFAIFVAAVLLAIAVLQVQIPYLDHLDKELIILLNFDGGKWMDNFWYLLTWRFLWLPMAVVVLITLFNLCPGSFFHKSLFVLSCLLMVLVLDQVSSGIIKPLVCRLRPSHDPSICGMLHYVNGYHGGQYGFVSGHATNNVGIITWLYLIYKNKLAKICFVLYAVFICYTRIYLGVHYLGDILCGSLLGFTIAYLSFKLVSKRFKVSSTKCPIPILLTLVITVIGTALYTTYQCVMC